MNSQKVVFKETKDVYRAVLQKLNKYSGRTRRIKADLQRKQASNKSWGKIMAYSNLTVEKPQFGKRSRRANTCSLNLFNFTFCINTLGKRYVLIFLI